NRPGRRTFRHGLPRAPAHLLGLSQGDDRPDRAGDGHPAVPADAGALRAPDSPAALPAGGGARGPASGGASMVTIAVTGERNGEPRVAISPETVKKLTGLGCTVRVEAGAGAQSRFADNVLAAQGATIAGSAAEALDGADILLKVRRPSADEV